MSAMRVIGKRRIPRTAVLLATALLLTGARSAAAQVVTEVEVERVRPKREKHATLRFLKENLDFIRARLDLLRQRPLEHRRDAGEIDPRFLAYSRMLEEILGARDSVASAEDARQRQQLYENITQLGGLESQLDRMEQLLAEQRGRLGILQANFTGDQRTALMVLLRGYPAEAPLSEVAITAEDGTVRKVALSPEQRESLKRGGIVEVLYEFAEPREQVLEVSVSGAPWPAGSSGFVTLDLARDRLTFLQLDLSTVNPAQGGASIKASTWLHDAETRSIGG
jgi:hypothetical protein